MPGKNGFEVEKFVEKPDLANAQTYLDSGQYLWNSGMFVMQPSSLLEQAAIHCASLLHQCQQVAEGATNDLDFVARSRWPLDPSARYLKGPGLKF